MKINKILIAVEDHVSLLHIVNYGISLASSLGSELGIAYIDCNFENDHNSIKADLIQKRHDELLDEINIIYPAVEIEEFTPVIYPYTEIRGIVNSWQPDLFVIGQYHCDSSYKSFGCFTKKELLDLVKIPILIIPNSVM